MMRETMHQQTLAGRTASVITVDGGDLVNTL